jgi:hypothetical protein
MNTTIQGQAPTSKLLTSDTPIILLKSVAAEFGVVEAAFLQQLHYISSQSKLGTLHNGFKWIYNTVDQWRQQLSCWSKATIERAIRRLRERGIIEIAKLSPHKSNRTNYYRIDYSKITHLIELPDSTLAEPAHQPDVMHPITVTASIPSTCSNGYPKKTPKISTKKIEPLLKKPTDHPKGTAQPTHPLPNEAQLAQIPADQLMLWKQLRLAKLDIAANDPRLRTWLSKGMVKTVLQTLLGCMDGNWRTPEQLLINWPNVSHSLTTE